MLKKTIFVLAIFFLFGSAKKRNRTVSPTTYAYSELFRDHKYYDLTDKGKELFFAVGIHPACVAVKGQCIQRSKCWGNQMLYISRVCYHRDLVCCYDNSIRHLDKALNNYTPPAREEFNTEAYIEPPVLP